MFRHFFRLQWKSFFRSSSFGKGIALKILMIFFAVYMLAALVLTGAGIYFILKKLNPDQSPIWTLSQYLIYWVLIEMFFRYFLQKLPVMDIKPFLILPIKKSTITHYILGRSGASMYNFFAIFFFLPFGVVLLFKGYPFLNVLLWLVSIFAIVLCINYVNFIVNKSDKALFVIIGLILLFYGLDYFQIAPIKAFFGPIFHALYAYPVAFLAPLGLAIFVYGLNYKFLRNRLFLDDSLKAKKQEAKSSDLAWTRRFGDIAPFLQLDLKLIWRNKRTKAQVFISLLFVFYGLIFYTQEIYANAMPMFAFLGIFMTGIFLANFGQFIPAWDSAYYSMMMSQNIPLRKYLDSKAGLISVSVVIMFLLTIPYVYFGWEALAINFGSALYNLGVNIPVILYFGSFNKKRIELDKSPFGNMQGTSGTQFLIMLPVLGAPILIFTIFYYIFSVEVGVAVLSIMGIVGFMLKNKLLDHITEQYRNKKYGMIAGFKEKNS
ncbi:MAG: DUF5687 family protein [Bacteroidota bacterium]